MNAEEFMQKTVAHGTKMLAKHQLLGEAYWDDGLGARWLIGQPDSSFGRTEIIAGIFGSLVVHGDFDTARFASYGDRADAWSRLLWMADCDDLGYYVAQKASIGMGGGEKLSHEYNEDVAQHDLRALIADYSEGGTSFSEGHYADMVEVLREALESYTEDEPTLRGFLHEHDKGWDLWEHTLGTVLRPHVVISHCALVRCAALLRERYGDEGPPATRRAGP